LPPEDEDVPGNPFYRFDAAECGECGALTVIADGMGRCEQCRARGNSVELDVCSDFTYDVWPLPCGLPFPEFHASGAAWWVEAPNEVRDSVMALWDLPVVLVWLPAAGEFVLAPEGMLFLDGRPVVPANGEWVLAPEQGASCLDVCEAYVRLGYLPPFVFCDPVNVPEGYSPRTLEACVASCACVIRYAEGLKGRLERIRQDEAC
jgi:hypothetical protein